MAGRPPSPAAAGPPAGGGGGRAAGGERLAQPNNGVGGEAGVKQGVVRGALDGVDGPEALEEEPGRSSSAADAVEHMDERGMSTGGIAAAEVPASLSMAQSFS